MDLESASDEELLDAFVAGNDDAYATLMRRHEDRIFALAFRMTGDRSDALEATQDTFISAFRRAHAWRKDAAFGTWLYRIGINACRDLMRKKRRRPEPVGDAPEPAQERGDRPLDDVVAARLDVAAALAELPDDYRQAVALHDLGGVPYEEIAVIAGVPIGTVKSRISRGRRMLARSLAPREQPPPIDPSKLKR